MKKSSLFVILLAICVLSFVLEAKPQTNADELCSQTLNPQTKSSCLKIIDGATSWDQASIWVLNRILRLLKREVEPTLNIIQEKLLPDIAPKVKSEIVATCRKSYSDVVRILLECKDFIRNDPNLAYRTYLGAASMKFAECREAIIEQKDQPEIVELKRFNDHLAKLFNVGLTIGRMYPRDKWLLFFK